MTTYAIVAAEPAAPPPGTGEGDQPAGPGGQWQIFVLMGVLFAVFYFLLIRPQRKKEQERKRQRDEMLSALKRNDHIVTIGGIHGVVISVTDEEVAIKVDEKNDVRIRMARDAISKVVGADGQEEGTEKTLGSPSGTN